MDAALIRGWHKTKGWSDIGYHFVILPNGLCEKGRPLVQQGAHCRAGLRNSIGIGICLVGDFSNTEVPKAQLDGLTHQVVELMAAYQLKPEDVELHRNVPGAVTECPGRLFPAVVFQNHLANSPRGKLNQ